jgi:hypothetical protein
VHWIDFGTGEIDVWRVEVDRELAAGGAQVAGRVHRPNVEGVRAFAEGRQGVARRQGGA